MYRARIISGFPGVGKTYFAKHSTKEVLDSDSSKFSWISSGVRNPDFPGNYMEHVLRNMNEVDFILVSSHKEVREALVDNNIHFTLVYPGREFKEEYLSRYVVCGSDTGFLVLLDEKWDSFIDDMEAQENCTKFVLRGGKYLQDILGRLIEL